jgi:hypothetical protein
MVHWKPRSQRALLSNPSVRKALDLLLQNHEWAKNARRSPWGFATEFPALTALGCLPGFLQWLVCKRYAKVGVRRRTRVREAKVSGCVPLAESSWFIATPKGAALARQLRDTSTAGADRAPPVWQRSSGTLLLDRRVVGRWGCASSYQRQVLDAFQNKSWPEQLPDLFRAAKDNGCPRQRPLNTVKNLNRHLRGTPLRFYVTKKGRVIGWRRVH